MYYIYVLLSVKNKDLYVGYTKDLKKRYLEHSSGRVRSTKAHCPWKLVYYEAYLGKLDATKREKQLKNHKAKIDLKIQLETSLMD